LTIWKTSLEHLRFEIPQPLTLHIFKKIATYWKKKQN